MSTIFVRPDHLHAPARVSSATSESGLTVAPPLAGTGNDGSLRLRASGTPTAQTSLDVLLQTGGNPDGYAAEELGRGAGVAAIWKLAADAGTLYRGYCDSIYLHRVLFPITYADTTWRFSTLRTLADGALGFIATNTASSACRFHRITTAWAVSNANIGPQGYILSGSRADFVVLPSGRLIAAIKDPSLDVQTWYSDDHGATWAVLSATATTSTGTREELCLEYAQDLLVLVLGSTSGAVATQVLVSRDAGCSFSLVDDDRTLTNPRTCVTTSGVVLCSDVAGATVRVRQITPGGGLGAAVNLGGTAGACWGVEHPLVTRDDGTVWVYRFEESAPNVLDAAASVSLDDGVTWTHASYTAAGQRDVVAFDNTPGAPMIYAASAGTWQGAVFLLLAGGNGAGDDNSPQLWQFGSWANVTEKRTAILTDGQPYDHVYTPIDLPSNVGWTLAGAFVTVTTQGPLNMVADAANNGNYTASATFAGTTITTGDGRRIRWRTRVSSGGDRTTLRASLICTLTDDGANHQGFDVRLAATGVRVTDNNGTTLADDAAFDNTAWVDWLIALEHDTVAATSGRVSVWYKRDADTTWTSLLSAGVCAEFALAANNRLQFGGAAGTAVTWDVAFLALADDDNRLGGGFTNPTDLPGRPLASAVDYYAANGIHLGARNVGGVPGDTYTVASTYQYPKEALWQELRPSRHVRSSADSGAWNIVLDAGANNVWTADIVALFGTNWRTGTFAMNATDAWGAPSVSVTLNATIYSGTVGTGMRGPGYFGPAASPQWRPHQWRSDLDAHRWFVRVGESVYEIVDNDEDVLFIADTDFSAAAGAFHIFGNRMGATLTIARYRFARISIDAQDTADGHYRVGTPIIGRAFAPRQSYGHGFVDGIEPNVAIFEADSGYRASARLGPRRHTLQVAWPNIDRAGVASDTEDRLRDWFAALEGSMRPVVAWRTRSDQTTLRLYRVEGRFVATNVWGEAGTPVQSVTRVETLTLVEEW